MKTIVIGIGNPIMADDSVGIKVVRLVRERINGQHGIETTELYAGGLRLMEAMIGYERAIIIDAISTEGGRPGSFYLLSPSDFIISRYISNAHDTDLSAALEMGRMIGLQLPSDIKIWAIEIENMNTFSEDLTHNVRKAVPVVAEKIIKELRLHI
jgi:hydrogenase maturation protease